MNRFDLAQALRNARESAGHNVHEAARLFGLHPQTYRNYEDGIGLVATLKLLGMFERYGFEIKIVKRPAPRLVRDR